MFATRIASNYCCGSRCSNNKVQSFSRNLSVSYDYNITTILVINDDLICTNINSDVLTENGTRYSSNTPKYGFGRVSIISNNFYYVSDT